MPCAFGYHCAVGMYGTHCDHRSKPGTRKQHILPCICRHMRKLILVLWVVTCSITDAHAQEDWQLRKNGEGIKVYSRKKTGQKFHELRVETVVQGTVKQLVAAITDVDQHDKWVYKALNTRLIRTITPGDFYYYTEIDAPWPFDNRDLVLRMTVLYNAQTRQAIINTNNANDIVPTVKDVVRITYSRGHWTLTPQQQGMVKIDYEITVDTGIGLPAWLLNMFIANAPWETFLHLRDWMKAPRYEQAKLSFLQGTN